MSGVRISPPRPFNSTPMSRKYWNHSVFFVILHSKNTPATNSFFFGHSLVTVWGYSLVTVLVRLQSNFGQIVHFQSKGLSCKITLSPRKPRPPIISILGHGFQMTLLLIQFVLQRSGRLLGDYLTLWGINSGLIGDCLTLWGIKWELLGSVSDSVKD